MNTLGLTAKEQLDHGLALLDAYEKSAADDAPNEKYLAAGLANCFTALWRGGNK